MKNLEVDFWNRWNRECRTVPVTDDLEMAGLRDAVIGEVKVLGLARPRFLEVCSGNGWLAEDVLAFGEYRGVELSPEAVARATKRVPNAIFEAADFLNWACTDTFDVLLCVDAIAYFRDQDVAVEKFASLVRPKGFLVVTTVNPFVYSRLSYIGPPGEGQVRKWLNKRELHALLRRHRFSVLRSRTIMPAGDRGILRLINARLPNRVLARVVPVQTIDRIKERCGIGRMRVVVAQRN